MRFIAYQSENSYMQPLLAYACFSFFQSPVLNIGRVTYFLSLFLLYSFFIIEKICYTVRKVQTAIQYTVIKIICYVYMD